MKRGPSLAGLACALEGAGEEGEGVAEELGEVVGFVPGAREESGGAGRSQAATARSTRNSRSAGGERGERVDMADRGRVDGEPAHLLSRHPTTAPRYFPGRRDAAG